MMIVKSVISNTHTIIRNIGRDSQGDFYSPRPSGCTEPHRVKCIPMAAGSKNP